MASTKQYFQNVLLIMFVSYSHSVEIPLNIDEATKNFAKKEIGFGENITNNLPNILQHKNYKLLASLADCGQIKNQKETSKLEKRLVGGRRTRAHPWMAQIYLHKSESTMKTL